MTGLILAYSGQAQVAAIVGRVMEVGGGLATAVIAAIYLGHGFTWMTQGAEGKAAAKSGVKETTKGYALVLLASLVAAVVGYIIAG